MADGRVQRRLAAILAADLEEGAGDLAQRAELDRFHERGEQVALLHGE